MELHFMERLLNYLKLTFIYMAKRSLVKRGKLLSKTILNLILHHQSHHLKPKKHLHPIPLALRDYEFSCSNSPDPMGIKLRSRIKSSMLSCFNGRSNNANYIDREHYLSRNCAYESAKCLVSQYMVTDIPGYGEDVKEEADNATGLEFENDVDYRAEKFIESFYEELRAQSLGNNFIQFGVEGHSS